MGACGFKANKFQKIQNINGNNSLIYCRADEKQYFLKTVKAAGSRTQKFNEEVKLIKQCSHPNVIQLKGIFISKNKNLFIITEFTDDGNLQMKLEQQIENKEHFSEEQIIDWFTQICLGLEYIHNEKIIHRNIKPSNIFCMKNGIVKLGDFGLAKMLSNSYNKTKTFKTFIENNNYPAPEIINKEEYSFEVDIWDLGITFYQLMYFQFPFEGESKDEIHENILNENKKQIKEDCKYSPLLCNIIDKMISKRKDEQPSLNDILNSSIIRTNMQSYLIRQQYDNEKANSIMENYENK